MEVDEESDRTSDIYPHWMAVHGRLKNEFTEDEKCHNLMSWLKQRKGMRGAVVRELTSQGM